MAAHDTTLHGSLAHEEVTTGQDLARQFALKHSGDQVFFQGNNGVEEGQVVGYSIDQITVEHGEERTNVAPHDVAFEPDAFEAS